MPRSITGNWQNATREVCKRRYSRRTRGRKETVSTAEKTLTGLGQKQRAADDFG